MALLSLTRSRDFKYVRLKLSAALANEDPKNPAKRPFGKALRFAFKQDDTGFSLAFGLRRNHFEASGQKVIGTRRH